MDDVPQIPDTELTDEERQQIEADNAALFAKLEGGDAAETTAPEGGEPPVLAMPESEEPGDLALPGVDEDGDEEPLTANIGDDETGDDPTAWLAEQGNLPDEDAADDEEEPGEYDGDNEAITDLDARVTDLEFEFDHREVPDEYTKIYFGKLTGAYTTGATATVTPCDAAGVATGDANVDIQANWTLPTTFNGNALSGTALTIPTTEIIPFVLAKDGKFYVLGQPYQAYGIVTYSTSTHKLYQTTWYEWGLFRTTISDAQEITTAVDCATGTLDIGGGTWS